VSLRLRVLLAMVGLILAVVVVAGGLAGHRMRPLLDGVAEERVDLAAYAATQVKAAEDPRARAAALSEELHVEMRLLREGDNAVERIESRRGRRGVREVAQDGHIVLLARGEKAPVLVGMGPEGDGPPWLMLRFQGDVQEVPDQALRGVLLVTLLALAGAFLLTRWVLHPLEQTGAAMDRIAAGELGTRLPTNSDAAGRIATTFNHMASRVEGLVRGQQDLTAAVSHELRTPLTRMRLQVELLRDQGGDEARLSAMEQDIGEIDALVEELLESSRLEQGASALRREPCTLESLWDEALAGVDLGERAVHRAPSPGSAEVDRRRTVRALRNMLTNISRYTNVTCDVWLTTFTDGDATCFSVADSGPGVPADALPRLFDPFFRVEKSRSKAAGGLGLGLMIVRRVAEAHGGSVAARNRPEGGLEVVLRLSTGPSTNPPPG
jgi:two-component system, OmpR family, sensor kinase